MKLYESVPFGTTYYVILIFVNWMGKKLLILIVIYLINSKV